MWYTDWRISGKCRLLLVTMGVIVLMVMVMVVVFLQFVRHTHGEREGGEDLLRHPFLSICK